MDKKRFCRAAASAASVIYVLLVSCSTPLQEITYLHGIEPGQIYEKAPIPEEYRIRPNDHLYIRVISDKPENVAFLNLIGSQTSMSGSVYNMELITYLVDESGHISYPFLGKIQVEGKTLEEVQGILQSKVDVYLQNASVFVKQVTRTVTVLGEVRNPGTITMVKSRMTILEVLGLAGDITDFGNRRNVKLIRELPEGELIMQIDLADPALISSPGYYMLPHDVLYVEHKTRVFGAKNLSYAAPLSIATSVITISLLLLNLFK